MVQLYRVVDDSSRLLIIKAINAMQVVGMQETGALCVQIITIVTVPHPIRRMFLN